MILIDLSTCMCVLFTNSSFVPSLGVLFAIIVTTCFRIGISASGEKKGSRLHRHFVLSIRFFVSIMFTSLLIGRKGGSSPSFPQFATSSKTFVYSALYFLINLTDFAPFSFFPKNDRISVCLFSSSRLLAISLCSCSRACW